MAKTISKKRLEMGEDAWAEYQRQRKNKKAERYRLSHGYHVVNWRRRIKMKLIEYKGGRCIKCGYDKKCPRAFAFHHRDPSQKDFGIGENGVTRSLERCMREIEKCDLMCVRCHCELHDEEYVKARDEGMTKYEERLKKLVERKAVKCGWCQKEFLQRHGNQAYCDYRCSRMAHRKVVRPTKEELNTLIEQKVPWLETGRRFGVSDTAVKKWAKSYGILPLRLVHTKGKEC